MNRYPKKSSTCIRLVASFLVSCVFLSVLYFRIDWKEILQTLKSLRTDAFIIYLFLFVPQALVAVWRWKYLLNQLNQYPTSFQQSAQMVLGGYAANLFIPAKMGELIRVFWINRKISKYEPLIVVIFEKLWDVATVFFLMGLALLFVSADNPNAFLLKKILLLLFLTSAFLSAAVYGLSKKLGLKEKLTTVVYPKRVFSALRILTENTGKLPQIFGFSVLLWVIQLLQFYFMFAALGVRLNIIESFAGAGLGVLAGALVISIGGIGPRDAAIIWFFNGVVTNEILVSVGMLSILRIVIPALFGLPFLLLMLLQRNGKTHLESS